MRFPYNPGDPPADLAELAPFLREELFAVQRGLEGAGVLRTKKLTGTTNAAAGGTVTVAHGLTPSKIVGIQAFAGNGAPNCAHGASIAANAFDVRFGATLVTIAQGAAAGGNVNNQPFTVLITYEDS